MNEPKSIFVIGPPGSGKGTQAERIHTWTGYRHYETSTLLRKDASEHPDTSSSMLTLMSRGGLVSSAIVNKVMGDFLESNSNENLIIDGFPRKLVQAELVVGLKKKRDVKVIILELADEICLHRLMNRPGGRPDDKETSIILGRLKRYHENRLAVQNHLVHKLGPDRVHFVSARPSVEEVFDNICLRLAA